VEAATLAMEINLNAGSDRLSAQMLEGIMGTLGCLAKCLHLTNLRTPTLGISFEKRDTGR